MIYQERSTHHRSDRRVGHLGRDSVIRPIVGDRFAQQRDRTIFCFVFDKLKRYMVPKRSANHQLLHRPELLVVHEAPKNLRDRFRDHVDRAARFARRNLQKLVIIAVQPLQRFVKEPRFVFEVPMDRSA